jgi:hemoglobin-like flavoprotein
MMTRDERLAIRRSWEIIGAAGDEVSDLFYQRLFELAPHYRPLFGPDLGPLKRKLVAMLDLIVRSLDWPDAAWHEVVPVDQDLFLNLAALGRRHAEQYAVPDAAYDHVGEALLWTLDRRLGKAFTAELRAVWARVYTLVAVTMRMGSCTVELTDVLQAVSLSRQLTVIELQLEDGGHCGTIWLKSGQVVGARRGATQGKPAFFDLVARPRARFRISRLADPPSLPQPIGQLRVLLLEAGGAARPA